MYFKKRSLVEHIILTIYIKSTILANPDDTLTSIKQIENSSGRLDNNLASKQKLTNNQTNDTLLKDEKYISTSSNDLLFDLNKNKSATKPVNPFSQTNELRLDSEKAGEVENISKSGFEKRLTMNDINFFVGGGFFSKDENKVELIANRDEKLNSKGLKTIEHNYDFFDSLVKITPQNILGKSTSGLSANMRIKANVLKSPQNKYEDYNETILRCEKECLIKNLNRLRSEKTLSNEVRITNEEANNKSVENKTCEITTGNNDLICILSNNIPCISNSSDEGFRRISNSDSIIGNVQTDPNVVFNNSDNLTENPQTIYLTDKSSVHEGYIDKNCISTFNLSINQDYKDFQKRVPLNGHEIFVARSDNSVNSNEFIKNKSLVHDPQNNDADLGDVQENKVIESSNVFSDSHKTTGEVLYGSNTHVSRFLADSFRFHMKCGYKRNNFFMKGKINISFSKIGEPTKFGNELYWRESERDQMLINGIRLGKVLEISANQLKNILKDSELSGCLHTRTKLNRISYDNNSSLGGENIKHRGNGWHNKIEFHKYEQKYKNNKYLKFLKINQRFKNKTKKYFAKESTNRDITSYKQKMTLLTKRNDRFFANSNLANSTSDFKCLKNAESVKMPLEQSLLNDSCNKLFDIHLTTENLKTKVEEGDVKLSDHIYDFENKYFDKITLKNVIQSVHSNEAEKNTTHYDEIPIREYNYFENAENILRENIMNKCQKEEMTATNRNINSNSKFPNFQFEAHPHGFKENIKVHTDLGRYQEVEISFNSGGESKITSSQTYQKNEDEIQKSVGNNGMCDEIDANTFVNNDVCSDVVETCLYGNDEEVLKAVELLSDLIKKKEELDRNINDIVYDLKNRGVNLNSFPSLRDFDCESYSESEINEPSEPKSWLDSMQNPNNDDKIDDKKAHNEGRLFKMVFYGSVILFCVVFSIFLIVKTTMVFILKNNGKISIYDA